MGDEGIVLTDREREALAGLAEQIGDPWLARQLAGGDSATPSPKRPLGIQKLAGITTTLLRITTGWIGLLFVVAGAALAVTTFTTSTLLGSFGLGLMGFGAWRVAADKADDLILRWKTARQARPAPPPPRTRPPRTPPGAA